MKNIQKGYKYYIVSLKYNHCEDNPHLQRFQQKWVVQFFQFCM